MKKHKIEIAVDHHEGSEFVAWLNKNGHDAAIGSSTGNYVDGEWTSSDDDANQILNNLWDKYCNGSAAAALGAIKSDKKAASRRENGKKGGRPRKERITIFLDAATDLSVACLPDSRADIEKFERRYKKAAKEYADEHNMIIDVETDPTAELPADFDEERHSKIWQAIHNMIPN